jgi:serum/glucocorticoid-regulated kinase 1
MQETFTMIAQNELKIPPTITDPATIDILTGLLRKQEERRLTLDQTKAHPYFEGIDWDALLQKQVAPPFVPDVSGKGDVSKIDEEFLAEVPNTDADSDSEEEVDDAMMDDAEAFFSGFLDFVSPEKPKV